MLISQMQSINSLLVIIPDILVKPQQSQLTYRTIDRQNDFSLARPTPLRSTPYNLNHYIAAPAQLRIQYMDKADIGRPQQIPMSNKINSAAGQSKPKINNKIYFFLFCPPCRLALVFRYPIVHTKNCCLAFKLNI